MKDKTSYAAQDKRSFCFVKRTLLRFVGSAEASQLDHVPNRSEKLEGVIHCRRQRLFVFGDTIACKIRILQAQRAARATMDADALGGAVLPRNVKDEVTAGNQSREATACPRVGKSEERTDVFARAQKEHFGNARGGTKVCLNLKDAVRKAQLVQHVMATP